MRIPSHSGPGPQAAVTKMVQTSTWEAQLIAREVHVARSAMQVWSISSMDFFLFLFFFFFASAVTWPEIAANPAAPKVRSDARRETSLVEARDRDANV